MTDLHNAPAHNSDGEETRTPLLRLGAMALVSANELMDMQLEAKEELVKGFLRPGTYLLAGSPKIGKSFLMTQLCACLATGEPFLGMETKKCEVAYLALEDTEQRMQERLLRMFGAGDKGGLYLTFRADAWERGDTTQEAVLKDLGLFAGIHPELKVVVIDTLQCVRESSGTDYSYASDYKAIQPFKEFADQLGIALILVHHTRKDQSDANSFNLISGTNGLLGAADGAFVLHRSPREEEAWLDFAGRDLPANRWQLSFDADKCLWSVSAKERELSHTPDPLVGTVVRAVGEGWSGTATELVALLKEWDPAFNMLPHHLTRKLNVLSGQLREQGVDYRLERTHTDRLVHFSRLEQ